MAGTQKIKTSLWFDGNAEEATNYYTSIFKDSKILNTSRYGEAGPGPKGSVMTPSHPGCGGVHSRDRLR